MKVSCGQCGRNYQVDAKMAGRTVKCKACDHKFAIPNLAPVPPENAFANAPSEPSAPSPSQRPTPADPIVEAPVINVPVTQVPVIKARQNRKTARQAPTKPVPAAKVPAATSPTEQAPSANALAEPTPADIEGPSDKVMRLVSGGAFLGGLLLLALNHAKAVMSDEVYVYALVLGPIAVVLGIAGVISPNVLRAAGKYGKHLPIRYKVIAAVVGVIGLIFAMLLIFVVYMPLG